MIKKILRRIRHVVEIQKYKKSASKNKNIPLAKGIAENGVLFIAFGRSYVSEAVFCAQSIRNCSDIGIAIFCDSIKSHERSLFDFVSLIEPNHSRAKVDYLKYTPFKNTLYLDSDTQVVEDITDIFSLLERFDLAMAHDFARKRQRWCEIIPEYKRIPDGFSEFGKVAQHLNHRFDTERLAMVADQITKVRVKEKTMHDTNVIQLGDNYSKNRETFRESHEGMIMDLLNKEHASLKKHLECVL